MNDKTQDKTSTENVSDLPALEALLDHHAAQNVVSLSIPQPFLADHFVLATCTSKRHIASLSEHLRQAAKKAGISVRIAGEGTSDWQVVDMGSIMVHLFLAEAREHYALEELWSSSEESV